MVLRTLLEEVFAERTDFELDGERLRQALARLDATAFTNAGEVALIETLHRMGVVAPSSRTRARRQSAAPSWRGRWPASRWAANAPRNWRR